jgi:hypothetical protein
MILAKIKRYEENASKQVKSTSPKTEYYKDSKCMAPY